MTTQQPHPLRCETCNHSVKHGFGLDCSILDHMPTKSEMKLIRQIGCASHSDASNPEYCADTCIYKQFAKNMENAERHDKEVREKVLDKIISAFEGNRSNKSRCVHPEWDKCQQPISMGCLDCYIEFFNSLRGKP